jgi:hypothetical protein
MRIKLSDLQKESTKVSINLSFETLDFPFGPILKDSLKKI